MHWGMLIDLRRCIGCQACTVACQNEHLLAPGEKWNRVVSFGPVGEYPNLSAYFTPILCMHCADAPCVKICLTGASFRREDGIVAIDEDQCLGCQLCLAVCPYGARQYNQQKGIVEKCTLCFGRLEQGGLPRCVEVCPLKARYVGDLDDPGSEIVRLIERYKACPLHPEYGTKPSLYYIFPSDRPKIGVSSDGYNFVCRRGRPGGH
jgi:Fe-S-cluster-containing dehydrogenase component